MALFENGLPLLGASSSGLSSAQLDSAGRFRTSEKETLFTHTNISNINHTMLKKLVGGGTVTHDYASSAANINVTSASGDKTTRQSYYYMPYLPGSPMYLKATGIFAPSKANVSQRLGIFDDSDGLFFEDDGTGMGFVRRSSTSGSPINERIPQSSWSIDKLNGSGPSGKTLTDFSKLYLYWIEYLWQGAVGYRAGMVIDGVFVPLHEDFTNRTVPFMRTPSLPIRYEIENMGASASPTTLKEICVDMVAEGGHRLVGSDWAFSNDGTTINVGSTEEVVLVVRLKDTFLGNPNRRMLKFLQVNAFTSTQDCHFRAAIVHDPSSVGAVGWVDMDSTHSGAEYNISQPTITGGDVHTFDEITVPASNSRSGEGFSESRFEDTHTIVSQNIDSNNSDLLVMYARALNTNTDITVGMKFLEFE